MATKNLISSVSLVAAADLTAKQFYVVKIDSAGKAALAGASDTTQVGILQDKTPNGTAATVATGGISKAVLGGTVASGAEVTSDANGKIIAATTGKYIIGICTAGGAANEIGSVLINPRGLKA